VLELRNVPIDQYAGLTITASINALVVPRFLYGQIYRSMDG
jgi:hypothetical protein